MSTSVLPPPAATFTSAPLRNRVRVQLNAPVAAVWSLIGDPARLPEYSAGLARVDAVRDATGACRGYVCYFRPFADAGEGVVSRERMRWFEPNRGYASSSEAGDAFGLTDDLNLVTVEAAPEGALVTWDEYYDAVDLPAMRAHFDEALADIAAQLIGRFGGRMIERFVDAPR
jgi:carbon monoxide dehydrogenase subunit G